MGGISGVGKKMICGDFPAWTEDLWKEGWEKQRAGRNRGKETSIPQWVQEQSCTGGPEKLKGFAIM